MSAPGFDGLQTAMVTGGGGAPACSHCGGTGEEPKPGKLVVDVLLQIKTVSEANVTGRRRVRIRRHKAQRHSTGALMLAAARRPSAARIARGMVVTLTRIGPRRLDSDNIHGALKHVRDGIADWLGVDDGDPTVTWEVAQQQGKAGEYAVRVVIRERRGA